VTDIGNSLREARIRKGLTIKDVETVTKIRSRYLEALEEDDFEVLPGPTYVKAFMRTYATFLKLDADAMVERYRGSYESRKEETSSTRGDAARKSRSGVGAPRMNKRVRRNQRGYALVGVMAVVIVVLLAWFGSGRGQRAASLDASNIRGATSSTTLSTESSGTTVAPGAGSSSTTTAGASTTTGSGPSVVTPGNVSLVVGVTQGSCWLVVREDSQDGAEIYAGTLSAGGQQTFASSQRYWMMVGKPEVLSLSVNGASHTLAAPAGSFIVTGAGVERSQ
jgi:cytoskeleton protein RodZ